MSKKLVLLLVLAAFSLCLMFVWAFVYFTNNEVARVARLMTPAAEASVEKEDPDVAFGFLRAPGLNRLLDGWTYDYHWTVGDQRLDTDLQAYGAREASSSPDIVMSSTTRDSDEILWIQYHGRNRYIRGDDPDFNTEFQKVLIDMAVVKLHEFRADMARREGRR